MDTLQRYIADICGAAADHPQRAQAIYAQAARHLTERAKQSRDRTLAARLQTFAQQFAEDSRRPATVSDFGDTLAETAAAYHEVGSPFDDMAPVARRREIHEERSPGLPRISIAPKSVNESTALGNQARLKWNPTEKDRQAGIFQQNTIARWQGFKEEAQAVTVDIARLEIPDRALGQAEPRVYGEVSYGSDGNFTKVRFDVGYGTRFTVAGSYVEVLAGLNPPRIDFQEGYAYVGCSLGFFAAPSLAPVMLTEYIDQLAGGATSVFYPRPAKAMMLLPVQSTLAAGTAVLSFYGQNQSGPLYVVNYTNSAQNVPIPITNDVAWVRVQNTALGAADFRLPWQLAL